MPVEVGQDGPGIAERDGRQAGVADLPGQGGRGNLSAEPVAVGVP